MDHWRRSGFTPRVLSLRLLRRGPHHHRLLSVTPGTSLDIALD